MDWLIVLQIDYGRIAIVSILSLELTHSWSILLDRWASSSADCAVPTTRPCSVWPLSSRRFHFQLSDGSRANHHRNGCCLLDCIDTAVDETRTANCGAWANHWSRSLWPHWWPFRRGSLSSRWRWISEDYHTADVFVVQVNSRLFFSLSEFCPMEKLPNAWRIVRLTWCKMFRIYARPSMSTSRVTSDLRVFL